MWGRFSFFVIFFFVFLQRKVWERIKEIHYVCKSTATPTTSKWVSCFYFVFLLLFSLFCCPCITIHLRFALSVYRPPPKTNNDAQRDVCRFMWFLGEVYNIRTVGSASTSTWSGIRNVRLFPFFFFGCISSLYCRVIFFACTQIIDASKADFVCVCVILKNQVKIHIYYLNVYIFENFA